MNNATRLVLTVALGAAIYVFALFLMPSLGLFEGLLKTSWVERGDITQVTLLLISLILIFIFSKGDLSSYGFKATKIKHIVKPALLSIPVVFLMFILTGIMMGISGSRPESGSVPLGGGMLKTIISVWLIASTTEEIFYRGLLMGLLAPLQNLGFRLFKSHISVPVTVCALGFGLGHLCLLGNMQNIIVISIVITSTLLGFIAGYYREKTGSLLPAIAAHMMFNIVGFTIPMLLMTIAPM